MRKLIITFIAFTFVFILAIWSFYGFVIYKGVEAVQDGLAESALKNADKWLDKKIDRANKDRGSEKTKREDE